MRAIEFIIVNTADGGPVPRVIGRCGDEPLMVGDEFGSIYRYECPAAPQGPQVESRVAETTVRLRIDGIQAYQRSLEILGQGMTGELLLSGSGTELLAAGMVLGVVVQAPTNGIPSARSNSVV